MVTAINRHARSKLSILSIVRKRYFPLSLFKIFEKIERNRSSFITFHCYPPLAFIYAYMYIYIYTRKCKSRIKTNGSYSRIESIPIVKWNQNTGRVQSECNEIFNHIELYILFKISYRVGPVRTYFKNTRLYRADPPKNLLHRPRNNDVRDPPYLTRCTTLAALLLLRKHWNTLYATDVFIVGLMIPLPEPSCFPFPRHNDQECLPCQIFLTSSVSPKREKSIISRFLHCRQKVEKFWFFASIFCNK